MRDSSLEKTKRQAANEDGQLLILPSDYSEEVGALSDPIHDLSSTHKDTPSTPNSQAEEVRKAEQAPAATIEDTALRDAVTDLMQQQNGMEVFVDEKAQQVLDEVNERARLNAKQKRALETASLPQREKDQPTVVSSAHGAKVLKNLDTLTTDLTEKSNRSKTFLGDLAQALGASTKGSSSQYATFETINGQIVTIRLANHNASSKRMDDAGRDNAISIVVSPKPNEGVTNDGDAHIVEFYYNSIKLRKAEGHPLAEIVRSIKQALYSGEYKDTTGLAEIQEVNTTFEKLREHRVFHGSGASFDAFNHIRFFRTKNGEAYGFTVGGKIYLDPRIATAETAIHEYAHLWADMLRANNPEAWNDIVQLMKGTSVWDEVKSLYPELKTDDEIADEVLAHYSGRQGAAKLSKEQHRIAHDQNMDLRSKATAIAALERINQALTKFWKGVADLLHIRFTTAEEVADRVLADLLHGVNPTAYAKREDGKVREMGTRVNRHMSNIASHFTEAKLTPSQQAVVDVYSGKSDNQAISVEREDGKRKVVMRQGNENHAGTKHSLFRHFNRNEGTITADDILLIPEVLEKGEVKIVKNGKGRLYTLEKDGVKYKVYTEKKDSQEIFCDFYTKKSKLSKLIAVC